MVRESLPPEHSEPSLGSLIGNLIGNLQDLIRGEISLAKQELKDEARLAAVGAGLMAGGAALALVGAVFVGLMLTYLLTRVVPDWVAALIVAVLAIIGAAILFTIGRGRLQQVDPVPRETIASLKEDTEWLKQQISSDKT